jgi:hypothetical protein
MICVNVTKEKKNNECSFFRNDEKARIIRQSFSLLKNMKHIQSRWICYYSKIDRLRKYIWQKQIEIQNLILSPLFKIQFQLLEFGIFF